jgi:hypothetical protein
MFSTIGVSPWRGDDHDAKTDPIERTLDSRAAARSARRVLRSCRGDVGTNVLGGIGLLRTAGPSGWANPLSYSSLFTMSRTFPRLFRAVAPGTGPVLDRALLEKKREN